MSALHLPSYLIHQGNDYYFDRRIGRHVEYDPHTVWTLYNQERYMIEQVNGQQNFMPLPHYQNAQPNVYQGADHAHQFGHNGVGGYYEAPMQAQMQPMNYNLHHHGNLNIGVYSNYGHQSVSGNFNFGAYNTGSHQHAPWAPQPIDAQFNLGGYNAPQMYPVQQVPELPNTSTPANVIVSDQSVVAEAPQVAGEVEVEEVPAPPVKSKLATWTKCKQYLQKTLRFQERSNAVRLFESMKTDLRSEQRKKYCEAHWPTEEAARTDIIEMSRYFLDANEMFMHRLKWDRLDALIQNQPLTEEQALVCDKLLKEVTEEKANLLAAFWGKKEDKIDREERGQKLNWVSRMKTTERNKRFGPGISKRQARDMLEAQHESERVEKKRRKTTAPARRSRKKPSSSVVPTPPVLPAPVVPAPLPTPEPSQEMGSGQDAEGETDDEAEVGETLDDPEDLEADMLAAFLNYDEEPAPEAEIATSASTTPEEDAIPSSPVPPPVPPPVPSSLHELVIVNPDQGYYSISPPLNKASQPRKAPISLASLASQQENTVGAATTFPEHVTAPPTISAPQEDNTVVPNDEITVADIDGLFKDDEFSEHVRAPPTISVTQEENTVVPDEDFDYLFQDDAPEPEMNQQEALNTTDAMPVEEQSPASTVESPGMEIDEEQEVEVEPEEEHSEPQKYRAELLAKKQAEIEAKEKEIVVTKACIATSKNVHVAKRMEKRLLALEAEVLALMGEFEELEKLSEEGVLEM